MRTYNTRTIVTPHTPVGHLVLTQSQAESGDPDVLKNLMLEEVCCNFVGLRERIGRSTIRVQYFTRGQLPAAGAQNWHADFYAPTLQLYLLYVSHPPTPMFLVDGNLELDETQLEQEVQGRPVWSPPPGAILAIDNRELHCMTAAQEPGWRYFCRVQLKGTEPL